MLTMWFWTSCLTSLGLSFLICELEIILSFSCDRWETLERWHRCSAGWTRGHLQMVSALSGCAGDADGHHSQRSFACWFWDIRIFHFGEWIWLSLLSPVLPVHQEDLWCLTCNLRADESVLKQLVICGVCFHFIWKETTFPPLKYSF